MAEGVGSMHELALRMAAAGKTFLIADGIIFVSIFLYLIIQAIQRGKAGKDNGTVVTTREMIGNTDPTARGISKQKVFYSRTKFVTMASLAKGTASRQDWYFVIGFNIAMLAFVFLFLGFGLISLPDGRELGFDPKALVFAGFPFVVAPMMVKMQYDDYVKTRAKLKQKGTRVVNDPWQGASRAGEGSPDHGQSGKR
jgi:hypothetical protein